MNILTLALVAGLPVSAPIADVHYDVTIDTQPVAHRSIEVAMHFRVAGPGPVPDLDRLRTPVDDPAV